jgi:2-dehydro-3-deoxyglucarate aldolase/4-hydroxy-2-oxoheptanedioate aldolase
MSISNLNKFRDKVSAGEFCTGIVVTLSDMTVSELAGDVGYDFTWIDMEHAPHTIDSAMAHIIALRGTDCAPFVRVPWNEHGIIKPILDIAPAGVIIPMVNSAEEAEAAVAACKYPPTGNRGCGVRRASRYGQIPFDEYLKISEKEPMVIIQIEHVEAVKNLDAILKVPGIDSICVGPCDLSGSMGKLNQLDDNEVCQVIDEVCRKTLAAGLMLGTAGGTKELCIQRGMHWAALDSDCGAIISQAKRIFNHIDNKRDRYV